MLAEIDLNLSDGSPWLLKVVSGPNAGAQFSMHPDTSYVIGTDPATCDIVFHDISVSRQHARIYVGKDNTLSVEDLQSSNGTIVDGKKTEGRQNFAPNTLINMGTTSFTVYDREGERRTVISPLLPAIVKILQQQGPEERQKSEEVTPQEIVPPVQTVQEKKSEHMSTIGSFLFVMMLCGLIVVIGIAIVFLFKTEEVKEQTFDTAKILSQQLTAYPGVHSTFNVKTGRLSLVGHVLTVIDRNQLLHDLRSLPFVKDVNDNVVIDENIWSETNHVLANNPAWKTVTIHSPTPGHFVITGYIDTRKQAEELNEYLSLNFPYIDLLEQKIVVNEDVLNQATIYLKEEGFGSITIKFDNGLITLSGNLPFGERGTLKTITDKMKKIPGVRDVKTLLVETPPVDTLVDLTGQYTVKGSLRQPNGQISVLINDKVLSMGDMLDGKVITKIEPTVIMLESGGIKYRIDYNR